MRRRKIISEIMSAVPCENLSSGICLQRRPRLACTHVQFDQGLCSPLTEYSTGSATLLRVAISSVETRKSRDFLWWKLRGISEEVTRV